MCDVGPADVGTLKQFRDVLRSKLGVTLEALKIPSEAQGPLDLFGRRRL
jgi:hypothetical protein